MVVTGTVGNLESYPVHNQIHGLVMYFGKGSLGPRNNRTNIHEAMASHDKDGDAFSYAENKMTIT